MPTSNPFQPVAARYLESQTIKPFQPNRKFPRKYLAAIASKDIDQIFIGWLCPRGSLFAYMYKEMKRQAKEDKKYTLASDVARAGWPKVMPYLSKWIEHNPNPVLIVPVPSRYGVSERFAGELYEALAQDNSNLAVRELFYKTSDRAVKEIQGWGRRRCVAQQVIALRSATDLSHSTVLLVDDIITSGSSLKQCARLLKKCGNPTIAGVVMSTNLFDSQDPPNN